MNERFKTLWFDAAETNNGDSWEEQTEFMAKFAELIVRECVQSLWTEECNVSDLALEEFKKNSKKIKQHFGVKE